MFDKGKPYRTPKCCEQVEKEGRGLVSKCVKNKHSSPSPIWRSRRPASCSSSPPSCPTSAGSSSSSSGGDGHHLGCPGEISGIERMPVFRLASSEEAETVLTSPRLGNKTLSDSQLRPSCDVPMPPFASAPGLPSAEEERQERDNPPSPSSPSTTKMVAGALEGCLISDLAASNPRTTGLFAKVSL
jgi:hypothetical protein